MQGPKDVAQVLRSLKKRLLAADSFTCEMDRPIRSCVVDSEIHKTPGNPVTITFTVWEKHCQGVRE